MKIDEAVAQEDREEKIADYIKRGAEQLSRKYRSIAIPLALTPMQTYLDLLLERFPDEHDRLLAEAESRAKRYLLQFDRSTHVTLTHAEFNEWLRQRGHKRLRDNALIELCSTCGEIIPESGEGCELRTDGIHTVLVPLQELRR